MSQGKSGIEFLRNNSLRTVDFWLIIPILSITTIGLYVLNLVLSQGFEGYPGIFLCFVDLFYHGTIRPVSELSLKLI